MPHAHGPRLFLETELGGHWSQNQLADGKPYHATFSAEYARAIGMFFGSHSLDYGMRFLSDGRVTFSMTTDTFAALQGKSSGIHAEYVRNRTGHASVHVKRRLDDSVTLQTIICEQAGITGQAIA